MIKTLILMRHAKSDWDDPLMPDFERPLNKRGRAAAPAIGNWITAQGLAPDLTLCSSANRTAETWALTGLEADIRFEKRLYHATADMMLSVLQEAAGDTVMMIGHNPGIADFAERLVKTPPTHPDFWRYPTAATLIATLDISDWIQAQFAQATAQTFIVPRDLTD
ncbi:histidine phosphatase family protein [Cognatishimia sp. MH4019]|uniref:SixA phosphatase family protein n=1 Tax=Cognatishimia sp. MH4019 TaxID=2854030 RepID=UPI001CD1B30C|nr:histidine phosphatase family protein [Cognatishimia sp. MH4019]